MTLNLDRKLIAELGGMNVAEAAVGDFKKWDVCANPSCAGKGKKRRVNSDGLCRGCARQRHDSGDGSDI